MNSLFFHSSGGVVIAGGRPMSLDDADALDALFRDQIAAAAGAEDGPALDRAARLAAELRAARTAAAQWRKAGRGLRTLR